MHQQSDQTTRGGLITAVIAGQHVVIGKVSGPVHKCRVKKTTLTNSV
jgi:hypothetical protein